jgi:hypothetical protein
MRLDAVALRKAGVFSSSYGSKWTFTCHSPSGGFNGKMNSTVVELPGVAMGLRLQYDVSNEVTSRRCQFGGLRFLFECPLIARSNAINRGIFQCPLRRDQLVAEAAPTNASQASDSQQRRDDQRSTLRRNVNSSGRISRS